MRTFRITQTTVEVFEVNADTYDGAVNKLVCGDIEESAFESTTHELVESWCTACKAVTCICLYERTDSSEETTKTVISS